MFGNKKLLTEGSQAQAVITEVTPHLEADTIQVTGSHDYLPSPRAGMIADYEIHARVAFEDGATQDEIFTTTLDDWTEVSDRNAAGNQHGFFHVTEIGAEDQAVFASLQGRLQPGKTVPVRYDSPHHKKVLLDLPALRDEMYAQAPSAQTSMPSGLTGAPGSGAIADMLQQAAQDPEGLRERLLAQAEYSGASAFVVTDAGVTPLNMPAPQQSSVADQLSTLADLHQRGVLTDAEFESQKGKLLSN
jgi:putative oligomerization/nucleic acid binding protein